VGEGFANVETTVFVVLYVFCGRLLVPADLRVSRVFCFMARWGACVLLTVQGAGSGVCWCSSVLVTWWGWDFDSVWVTAIGGAAVCGLVGGGEGFVGVCF